MRITTKLIGGIFGKKRIVDKCRKANEKYLNWAGGYVKQAVKRTIRPAGKKGKVSKPGEPPRSRTGLLRNFILYNQHNWNSLSPSVHVGPKLLRRKRGLHGKPQGQTTPEVLEFGGAISETQIKLGKNKWRRVTKKNSRFKTSGKRTVWNQISKRPYLAAAISKAKAKFEQKWKNLIR